TSGADDVGMCATIVGVAVLTRREGAPFLSVQRSYIGRATRAVHAEISTRPSSRGARTNNVLTDFATLPPGTTWCDFSKPVDDEQAIQTSRGSALKNAPGSLARPGNPRTTCRDRTRRDR